MKHKYVVQRRYSGITAQKTLWMDMSRPFQYAVDASRWLDWMKSEDKTGKPFRIIKVIEEN